MIWYDVIIIIIIIIIIIMIIIIIIWYDMIWWIELSVLVLHDYTNTDLYLILF